ncbi:MAG: response regulator transcription factor [Clostridia bacterium]|nr:response regulator transcription factor [Clostridia bacterium]
MKSIDILCADLLYAEMLKLELERAGYSAHIGRSATPDLIICDLDTNEAVKGPFVLTFSRDKDAHLCRPFDIEEFLLLVSQKLSEEEVTENTEIKKSTLYVSPYERYAVYNNENIELSELEHRLLLYLYNNKSADINELSLNVFGEESNPNLVRVYINYLRKKIDNRFKVRLITTKRNKGYCLGEDVQ